MGDFKGSLFHSSKWDTDLDIRGKRVANIGNGSSSTQIVPAIVDTVESVTVFQATAQWILPVPNQPVSAMTSRLRTAMIRPILERL